MWRYDLHVHTRYSPDCDSSLESVIRRAERIGLRGIAITDHDSIDGALVAQGQPTSLEIICGCERTLQDGSHIIGLYLKEVLKGNKFEEVVDEIERQSGLVLVPHPFRARSGLLHSSGREQQEFVISHAHLLEAYNGGCSLRDNQLAAELAAAYDASACFVSSSDAHLAWQIGAGQVCLENRLLGDLSRPTFRQLLNLKARVVRYGEAAHCTLALLDNRPLLVRLRQHIKQRFPRLAAYWPRLQRNMRITNSSASLT